MTLPAVASTKQESALITISRARIKVGEPVCERVPSASPIEGPITAQGQTVLRTFCARSGNGRGPSRGEVGSGAAVGRMRDVKAQERRTHRVAQDRPALGGWLWGSCS
jgi:hypothetical protein